MRDVRSGYATRRTRRTLLPVLVTVLALAAGACGGKEKKQPVQATLPPGAVVSGVTIGASGPPTGDTLTGLQNEVQAGRLDKKVLDDFQQSGSAEAIIVLDDDVVNSRVRQQAQLQGRTLSDEEVLAEKMRLYQQLKQQALAIVPNAAQVLDEYETLGIVHVKFTNPSILLALLGRPEISGVRENATYKEHLKESLSLINQPQAVTAGFTGDGVTVTVLDSGLDYKREAFGPCTAAAQPADRCRVAYVQDFAPEDGSLDGSSLHGTNIAAIVAGVAPKARVIGLDVFDGDATSSALSARAIDWVITNRAKYNIVAVNMSLGGSYIYQNRQCPESPYASAFSNLRLAGILPVVSAGNDGWDDRTQKYTVGIGHPACVPGAISVGAVYDSNIGAKDWGGGCNDRSTKTDQPTCFSNAGPTVSLYAPGAIIDAGGVRKSGTSQAAPHVAGAVAALSSKCRAAKPEQIEQALTSTGPEVTDTRFGTPITKHRLDVAAAGQALDRAGACKAGATPSTPVAPASTPTTARTATPARTPSPNAQSGQAQVLYNLLLTRPWAAGELPSGFTNPRTGPFEPDAAAKQNGVVGTVYTNPKGPDTLDAIFYDVFPTDAAAKAYYDAVVRANGIRSQSDNVACANSREKTSSGNPFGQSICLVLQGGTVVTALTAVAGDQGQGNPDGTVALAKAALAHLARVQGR